MTMKEIEERTGLTRANVRYYETEGLICPRREKNGYRDYSEEDLQILLKIKLLRTLHVSLEDIKGLQSGVQSLGDLLDKHIHDLEAKKNDYEYSKRICVKMHEEGAGYDNLNAQRYLGYMEQGGKENRSVWSESANIDVVAREVMPWRRFFARRLDFILYIFLWNLLWIGVFGNRNMSSNLLSVIMALLLMCVLEPILLAVFGTTPGKWVLGLYVTELGGEKPDYSICRQRTMYLLWYGLGLEIPGYSWFRMYKSYKGTVNKEDLPWEYRTNVCCKRDEWWQIIAYVSVLFVMSGLLTLVTMRAGMPDNRGSITPEEFCEDFNELAEYYGWFQDSELLPSGEWNVEEPRPGTVVIYTEENHESPNFEFWQKDGELIGLGFEKEIVLQAKENEEGFEIIRAYQSEMALAVLTYLKAQENYPFWSDKAEEIANNILQNGYRDFVYEEYSVKITYDIEYRGFSDVGGMLLRTKEDTEARCYFRFEIRRIEEQ